MPDTGTVPTLDLADARTKLGEIWGLGRAITKRELARALGLSPKYGDEHVAKIENGKTTLTGPIEVAVRMMLEGARPYTMADVIKPGYPRGAVRV